MRKSLFVIAAVLLSALVVLADDDSQKYEAFAGYNFVRFNPASTAFIPSFNANGGNGQFVYNVWHNFGVVLDMGAVTKGTLNHLNIDSTALNFVAGPRYTLHLHESRFQPFVQALFGGVYATSSTHLDILDGTIVSPVVHTLTSPITARLVESRTGFAMLAGGGLDFKINKHMSFRPIGADYYLTRLPDFLTQNLPGHHHHNANNFRYSTGVNFIFGKE